MRHATMVLFTGGNPSMFFLWIFLFFLTPDEQPSQLVEVKTILFLGDSLTEGFGVGIEKSFPSLLQKHLKKMGIETRCINAGISGATSASALTTFKWHLKQNPNILILSLGANDGLRGIPVESTKLNLTKVIELAQKKSMCIILTGMKCPQNYGNAYHISFEKMFVNLSKTFKTEFMPFLLQEVAGVRSLNIKDGIHPNEKGQELIAKNLLKYLLPVLQNPQKCSQNYSSSIGKKK